jgi:hypothetical protein
MKNTIGIIIILLIEFSCAKPPQDSRTFKIHYQPAKKYNQTTERTSQTVIKFSGKEISLQRLKARGVRNPTISDKKSRTETVLKTGKLTDRAGFPVTLEIVKTISNDGKKDFPDGAIFKGHCLADSMPTFNSMVSVGLDSNYKMALVELAQSTFSQLAFPVKKLKIGEQFSEDHPLSMPMEGSTIEMVVTTNYKLISISKGIAAFDISQTYTMTPTLMDNSFKGSANGKGHLLYDIDHTIILNYTINTEMQINKRLDSFDFDMKTKSGFIQITSISEN